MLNGSMIIERVENENGIAIKFPDGTMICTKIVYDITLDQSSSLGLGLGGDPIHYSSIYWTYPVKFTRIYSIHCSPIDTATGVFGGEVGAVPNNTNCEMLVYGAEGSIVGASMLAIGRWK